MVFILCAVVVGVQHESDRAELTEGNETCVSTFVFELLPNFISEFVKYFFVVFLESLHK